MSAEPKQVRVGDLLRMKQQGTKIVALTAYDALFAGLVDEAGTDVILIGDSVNTVLCGAETTLSATLEQMLYHGRIVKRGVRRALVVLDMPYLSYQVSVEDAKRQCGRALKETGVAAVKLEGGTPIAPTVQALVTIGIPVMGHLGFTPQSVHALSGHRVQGRDPERASAMVDEAKALEDAGAFAIVLELMPSAVAERITKAVAIPTIGIGSGPDCDGQVLVLHDMLGLNDRFHAKFVKRYAQLADEVRSAICNFGTEVRDGTYPDDDHSFAS